MWCWKEGLVMSNKLLRGTFILTAGTFLSKFLGLFYVIPFYAMIGSDGTVLYQYAYTPYTIAISLATAGVPLAVSKFVSKYNALEEYALGRKLFRSGLLLMSLTGILFFLLMYAGAPVVAEWVIVSGEQKVDTEEVISVLRAVSFALLVVPIMSLFRGFFQGHESYGPSSVSTVLEQVVRIVVLLGGTFFVLYVLDGSTLDAVNVSTFAAFVGAIAGLFMLIYFFTKRKKHFDQFLQKSKNKIELSTGSMYKELLLYAGPFVFVGIANPLFQLIDQFTFNRAMVSIGLASKADQYFEMLNFASHKLVIIPVSLATAFSLTLIPAITRSFVKQDRTELYGQMNQTFQVLLFLTVPACVGLSILAEPLYTLFYEASPAGSNVLQAYAPVAILFSLFSVTAAMLQGINQQRFTLISLGLGLIVKFVLNMPLIQWMETQGAITATAIGYGVTVILNLVVLAKYTNFSYRLVVKRTVAILMLTAAMAVVVSVSYLGMDQLFSSAEKGSAFLIVIVSVGLGALFYLLLAARTRLLHRVFPLYVKRIQDRLLRS